MAYTGFIVKVEHLRKHTNADRLQIATFFGNDTIVGLDTKVGDMGVYFPVDGQLSEEFCRVNDLVRRKDENGNQCGGYLDPEKRNIKALKLRGEKSDGLYLPIVSLSNFTKISDLKVGDTIDILNGQEICRKYIPVSHERNHGGANRVKQAKKNFAPTFYEHIDTKQLAYNYAAFKAGDEVQLTLKMHGTSGRTGYLPLIREVPRTFLDKLLRRTRTKTEYGYVTGTRRVVLDATHTGGFYEDNSFRQEMAKKFEGKLHKGEVVYYEIVGFQGPNGAPIMASVANSKIKDKEFTKQYGAQTIFAYGCDASHEYDDEAPCCDIYVYRMTMVNEDGDVVEYSPDQIKMRCEQMGIKVVPEFCRFYLPNHVQGLHGEMVPTDPAEYLLRRVEEVFDGPDPVGKTHVREGVVVRIMNRTTFEAYKHKNFSFKILEGIAKDEATAPDLEEAQEEFIENADG